MTLADTEPHETPGHALEGRGERGKLLPGSIEARDMARASVEAKRAKAHTPTDAMAERGLRILLRQVIDGTAPVSDKNLPQLIRVLHDVVLLQRGQATQISERVDIAAELRELAPALAALGALRTSTTGELDPAVIQVESVAGESRAAATTDEHAPGP